ncbi:MAG TPA: nuclear transport factor 2 family protein [Ilumatobacteraceae bacterium]|nr:nuclear transport factor 2 family protein [Ilumatobacteraceae bacterium]
MNPSNHDLVSDYITAVSEGDFERLAELVHPDASFGGTVAAEAEGAEAFVQGFRNLRPITVRCDVRKVIVEGSHASVLYDFVTDTNAGSVLCAEFLTIEDDLIRSSTLLLDWRHWPDVIDELRSRMAQHTQPA